MGDQLQLRPELHRDQDYGTTPTVDLAETLSEIGQKLRKGWKSLFGSETTVSDKQTTSTAVVSSHVATEKCVYFEGLSIPQTYASRIETFYGQYRMYAVDYKELYENAPSVMVSKVVAFLPGSPDDVSDRTYEEIMRDDMEYAKEVNNNYVKAVDLLLKVCIGWGGIQRTSLCVLWANLLFELFSKFTSTITLDEKNRIARGGIALAIGTSIAIMQYFHKSPAGITNYLRLLYEGYNNVRDRFNQRFPYKIPDILRMESPRKEFAVMTDDEKTTVGQMLNMVYTFRIGDMYLDVCSKSSTKTVFSDSTILDMIDKGISPLPERNELEKIYKLYTDEKLYRL